ncbi:MAG: glycosyltransferase family 4 protein [Bryobacteraceae bacterium]
MKILWVNSNFMHPTTKGGQIRTLEMLRHLHSRHEIHYVAIENPNHPEGPRRSGEYSTRSYPYQHKILDKRSPGFFAELAKGVFSSIPVAVSRFHPPGMSEFLENLIRKEGFDKAVVDHLAPTAYFPRLEQAVFFQHNVETVIWRRHVEHAADPLRRLYFRMQADRMYEYERRVSRASGHIVAVSAIDAEEMRKLFGVTRVSEIPTGVNLEYFTPKEAAAPTSDLVFIGSMDWLPNVDGMLYFVREILPLIHRKRPETTLAIVGRTPPPEILELAKQDSRIQVTGTVPDIRPHVWGAKLSVVPLRIGGGTRLKIYESMAARVPVVSTTIGAEGLAMNPPDDIRLADNPQEFAAECLELLADDKLRTGIAHAAWDMVSTRFSWDSVSRCFERILEDGPSIR